VEWVALILLRVRDLEVIYGGVRAVKRVSLDVREGEVRVILGANGAGKSSLLKAVIGVVKPKMGTIEFADQGEIQHLPAHRINRMGVAWVPEGREVFGTLTVEENLRMGAFNVRDKDAILERSSSVYEDFPILRERREQLAGSLSGGEQQMLAIGRALMSGPRLILMDEPSLGLAPKVVQRVMEITRSICERGISILMAEQNARQALKVADHAYLVANGEIKGHGTSKEMARREDVRRAYLGA
jgi:branched-chain amino acid transport system ATP-binding protein